MSRAAVGFVDLVADRAVHGWAWIPEQPHERPLVWVDVNGRPAGVVRADTYRADLREAGIGDGTHAFAFPVSDDVDEIRQVTARFEDMTPLAPSDGFAIDPRTNVAPGTDWRPGTARFPSFFVVGAAKSGTTSLHDHLAHHPDVCMSEPKEPFYFEAEHHRGAGWYRNRYFAHWEGEPAVGESRHRNLYLPWIPRLIAAHNPDARVIAIVRDPVRRLVSHWWHWHSRGIEPLGLEAAVDADLRRIEAGLRYETEEERWQYRRTLDEFGKGMYGSYVDSGHYARQLRRYVDLLGAGRVLVVRFEELTSAPRETLARAFAFVGVDPECAAELSFPHRNRSEPGAEEHVTDALLERLHDHYLPHERALEELLAELASDPATSLGRL